MSVVPLQDAHLVDEPLALPFTLLALSRPRWTLANMKPTLFSLSAYPTSSTW